MEAPKKLLGYWQRCVDIAQFSVNRLFPGRLVGRVNILRESPEIFH
jgi:hypothetical protein